MIRKGLFDANLFQYLWCCSMEDGNPVYSVTYHDEAKEAPGYLWYKTCPHISVCRTWGYYSEAKLSDNIIKKFGKLEHCILKGFYIGTSPTKSVNKYWSPDKPSRLQFCTTAKFNDKITYTPDGKQSPGSFMSLGKYNPTDLRPIILNIS